MYQPIKVTRPEERDRFCDLPGQSPLNAEVLASQQPDALWMLTEPPGVIAARCSLWWSATPPLDGLRLGLIGHYAAINPEAAAQILKLACGELSTRGCTRAVGPMDGNTWQRYRLIVERGDEPTFFLEPDNPDDWPSHFTRNGFHELAHYYSALGTNLEETHPRLIEIARRVAAQGIRMRILNLGRFEDELRSIHALSLASFQHNFLYTPIEEEEFIEQYLPMKAYVRPELVLIAELSGKPVGYVFGVPDLNQARRGRAIDTVVLKTLAVHPDQGGIGLGSLLTARCHESARLLGYTRIIHALMYENNRSRKISSHTARPIRRYALYSKPLGQ